MKTLILTLVAFSIGGCANVPAPVASLRSSNLVEGSSIGFSGSEGNFSRAFHAARRRMSFAEIQRLVAHDHAPLRLLGYVLAFRSSPQGSIDLLARAEEDQGEISFREGCDPIGYTTTIARLIRLEVDRDNPDRSILVARK